MKLCVILGVLSIMATSSIAAAQSRCPADPLTAAAAQGRNAWAANCGYIQPAAVPFYNAGGEYVVFTTGCGHAGCSPFVPVTATDPCIGGLVKLALCEGNFSTTVTFSVFSLESGVDVTSPGGVVNCDSSCSLGYLGGTPLTIRLTSTRNTADCLQFTGWRGPCAGQGSTCSIVINSSTSESAIWSRISGCVPK